MTTVDIAVLLNMTSEFREEAAKLLGEGSISQYMERVITKIEAEDVRSRSAGLLFIKMLLV